MSRVYNFNPGPATLPLPVLEQAQQELVDYQGRGYSILEASHRSKEYEAINGQAEARLKALLGLGEAYRVVFLQGGASLQFAMLPMNFLTPGSIANYILTGSWSEKALKEAEKVAASLNVQPGVHVAASTSAENYRRVTRADEIHLSEQPAYVHITTNNTIYGTQWHTLPDVGDVPLVADMSSDILSRPLAADKLALFYAGAQKNLGPAGVTVVVLREAWLEQAAKTAPTILRYATHVSNDSLYNTPPAFAVYLLNLVLGWIEDQGGLTAMGQHNDAKAQLIYAAIDQSNGFYQGHAEQDSRSLMNITFRLPDEALEKQFVSEASAAGMLGLKGHRSVGGIRASVYNAMPLEGCRTLADFMADFARRNG